MGWLDSLFGGGDDEGGGAPSFYQDPYYSKVQNYMFPYASSILEGKPNDYYAPIGNWGGKELEDMIGLTTRDTQNAVDSSLVRSGLSRSGIASEVMAKQTADTSTGLRWADFNRAMSGRQFLLGAGMNAMSGIRSAGLENQSQNNQFNMNAYKMEQDQQQGEDNMWAQLLSSGIGAMGNMYGMNMMKDMYGSGMAPSSMKSDLGTSDWNNLLGQLKVGG